MNKSLPFLLLAGLLLACQTKPSQEKAKLAPEERVPIFQEISAWDSLLFAHDVSGAILILDSVNQTFYGNDSVYSSQGYLPASTFKIPNSLTGLAAGAVKDEHSVFFWDGEDRFMSSWEEDLTLGQAFKRSCLPCYQEMARDIGFQKMKKWTDTLGYGQMDVTEENYDRFWVDSKSIISPFEQIAFLQRIFKGDLPHTQEHIEILKKIMILEKKPNFILRAKTGWSIQEGFNRGWFVGRLEKGSEVYYFATHLEPVDQKHTETFGKARIAVSKIALAEMEDIVN